MPVTAAESRRRWRAAALAAASLLLVGCGGSSHASKKSQTSSTSTTKHRPSGPAGLAANLTGLMAKNSPQLSNVRASCPPGPVTSYPVGCRFTATAASVPISHAEVAKDPKTAQLKKPHAVAGTITVFGIFAPTNTYTYRILYAPTFR